MEKIFAPKGVSASTHVRLAVSDLGCVQATAGASQSAIAIANSALAGREDLAAARVLRILTPFQVPPGVFGELKIFLSDGSKFFLIHFLEIKHVITRATLKP